MVLHFIFMQSRRQRLFNFRVCHVLDSHSFGATFGIPRTNGSLCSIKIYQVFQDEPLLF